jgi:hypothetical protein
MENIMEKIQNHLNAKIEFQSIRGTYPLTENLYCYFTVPTNASVKPEAGDWIGIYRVGWTGIKEYKCRKMVKLTDIWGKQEESGQVVLPYQLLTEQQQTPQQTQLQGLIKVVQRKLQGELVEELDQRRREQTKYNTQLRMFERLVEQQLKKVANLVLTKQVGEFEQKIQNLMRLTGSETREQQVEKYIARFESLVREKLRFDNEQKQAILQGLYKVITDCDAQLKELQQSEIQYLLGCHQELKERSAQIQQQAQQRCYNPTQVREPLRQLERYFGEQQQQQQQLFKQAQEQLEQIITEIEWQINEIEGAFQQQQQQQTMGRQQQQQQTQQKQNFNLKF